MKKSILTILAAALVAASPLGADGFELTSAAGVAESLYAEWSPVAGSVAYQVYVNDAAVDAQLVRRYPASVRVDVPGLAAGSYTVRVEARNASGTVIDEAVSAPVAVDSRVREGFAFTGGNLPGAYKADGTLRDDASVIYVTASTVNTVTLDVVTDKKGKTTTATGLAAILSAMSKGYHKQPLAIRVIGTVTDTQFSGLKDGNYINFQGSNATDRRISGITLEGIGNDAVLYGYGICFKRSCNIEISNLAIMLFGDDAISMDTDNSHIWLHNIDFFYGRPGRDADQVKGDGSIDMKYRSTDITIDHNHFWDSGKVMGCGGTTGETENLRITYHHNWFDHADSRCPRLHYTTAHVYNNYYDGVPVYCIGNTTESSAFVECNYFRNCKRPMMISGQGTDSYDAKTGTYTLKGTFSGQNGGMTKAYNNVFAGEIARKLVYQTDHATQFDAWLVSAREEAVPATALSVKGGWAYNNFDTAPDMYVSHPDEPAVVPDIVTARAGRLQGGDLKWRFDNATDDEDHSVNAPLKEAVTNYVGQLVAVQGEPGFSDMSGIESIAADYAADAVPAIYDLAGRRVAADAASLPAGVYIMKTNGKTLKIKK